MARLNINTTRSEYYPPRARWYSGLFSPWFALRRALHLENMRLPAGLSPIQLALALTVPGFAFFTLGRRILGQAFLAGYALVLLIFVAALGYFGGNICFGLMISAHATSIIYVETRWLRDKCQFRFRLALAVGTLLGVWLAVYAPMLTLVERHWILPLQSDNRVIIVSRMGAPASLQRGDWAAFRLSAPDVGGVYVRAGFVLGPVLAVGGDNVVFGTNSFTVNNEAHRLLPYMPNGGELAVPEKHWFLWPGFAIHGGHGDVNVTGVLLEMATVSQEQFIGKPFKRWFWRRQTLPPLA